MSTDKVDDVTYRKLMTKAVDLDSESVCCHFKFVLELSHMSIVGYLL